MRYFTFMGESCLDILGNDNPLILVSLDGEQDEVQGSQKKVISGDTSIYKTVANEYGNMYEDVLEFEYSLIKYNDELITQEEQRVIETWLTSPKLSQYLQLFDLSCDGETIVGTVDPVAIYCGTFTETTWMPHGDGYIGVTFTFQCDSPYAWQFHEETRYLKRSSPTSSIMVYTDETQDYIYPRISFKVSPDDGMEPPIDIDYTLTNVTDDNASMTIYTHPLIEIVMDCKLCRLTDNAGNLITYEDIGWGDVGNIYWPRLTNGINTFQLDTIYPIVLTLEISYMSPYKIVGGWL